MEPLALTPEIERESQHVAAAFGIEHWEVCAVSKHSIQLQGDIPPLRYQWRFTNGELNVVLVCLIKGLTITSVSRRNLEGPWRVEDNQEMPEMNELMARGLCRLGFGKDVLAQLPPLSAHEQLELRLSLPREFWPPNWQNQD